MTQKNINIIIILAIAVIVIFMALGFFGLNGFNMQSGAALETPQTPAQALLNEVQSTGSVSDLKVVDVMVGSGDPVVAGDTLTMNYTGVLPDGTVFDSSDAHGQPFTFTIGTGQVIQGWELGILGMKEGGRRLLAIPAALGYGANANGAIPANSTLIFEVELLNRVPAGSASGTAQ